MFICQGSLLLFLFCVNLFIIPQAFHFVNNFLLFFEIFFCLSLSQSELLHIIMPVSVCQHNFSLFFNFFLAVLWSIRHSIQFIVFFLYMQSNQHHPQPQNIAKRECSAVKSAQKCILINRLQRLLTVRSRCKEHNNKTQQP